MIDVNDITFGYSSNRKPVFSNFSLKLKENCICGILGKNGTGKSTLLYLICGLLRTQKGTIEVDGINSSKRSAAMLQDIFIVPEEFELPNVSLSEYVKVQRPFYPNFSDEVLEHCLSEFELQEVGNLKNLSMGQKKKVYMSFALATNTRYLLMDEPTNGLDIPSKVQFRKVMAEYMSEERTILISTHQVHDVDMLLDHILILSGEGVMLNASTAELCEKYSFEYRSADMMDSSVIYAEPTLQGNAVITRRTEGAPETTLNLELLFNAIVTGTMKQ